METGQKTTDTAIGRSLNKLRKPFRIRIAVKDIDPKTGSAGPTKDKYLWCIKDIKRWKKMKNDSKSTKFNRYVKVDYENSKPELTKIEGGKLVEK